MDFITRLFKTYFLWFSLSLATVVAVALLLTLAEAAFFQEAEAMAKPQKVEQVSDLLAKGCLKSPPPKLPGQAELHLPEVS